MGKEFYQGKPNPELVEWANARQRLLQVKQTTITKGGHTLDWIPIESQSKEKIATPPPSHARHTVQADPTKQASPVRFDTSEPGPAGHVPVLRPDLSKVSETKRLTDFLSKRGGSRVNINRKNKKPTDPNPAGYFHASSSQTANVYGCDAVLNVWDPKIGIPSTAGDDHSISQTWLQNYQTGTTHSVEAGLTVDLGLNGDAYNHLFLYFTTNGYTQDGDNMGGYNRLNSGWVQWSTTIYPGIQMTSYSVTNGAQAELGIKFELWAGNWWFGVDYSGMGNWTWIGYYPGSLFTGGLLNHAEWVAFGGEVWSGLANPCDTKDQMGSGIQASGGYRHAAYQRNLHNQSDAYGTLVNFNGVPEVDAAASDCVENDYTIECFMNSGTDWESYQYYGGPRSGLVFRVPTEGIWQWVDYGTMVDDGVHPWNPDFRYLLAGIVMADLAKYTSPSVTRDVLNAAAKQIAVAAEGIVKQINEIAID